MRGFQTNNCRLCQKVFCCQNCRMKHEEIAHKVFPDCDICVFGKFFFANFNDHLLKHLESSHLPVRCVNCKKVFSSVEDILQHKTCDFLQTKDLSPKTPFRGSPALLVSTDDHDSPILQELQRQEYLNYILATSTPMQRGEEPNLMFEKSKEVITPVDKPTRGINKSIIKKADSDKANEQLSKRRVTFGETPTANTLEKNTRESITGEPEIISFKLTSNKVSESLDGQSLDQKSNGNFTPVMGMSTGQFYSMKTEADTQFYSAKTDVSSKPRKDGHTKMSAEGCTPVGIPNRSKFINVKGDIYKKEDQGTVSSEYLIDEKHIINETEYLDEVSMELCTPAKDILKPLDIIPNSQESVCQEPENKDISSPLTKNVKGTPENETKQEFNLCTPAKTSNPGKMVVKGDIYKYSKQENVSQLETSNPGKMVVRGDLYKYSKQENVSQLETSNPGKMVVKGDIYKYSKQENVSQLETSNPGKMVVEGDIYKYSKQEKVSQLETSNPGRMVVEGDIYKYSKQEKVSQLAEVTKQDDESGWNVNQNNSKYVSKTKQVIKTEIIEHDTLWLSAINVEELNDFEQQNENKSPVNEPTQDEINPLNPLVSPQRNNQRIVVPTPILETTNVQMKFHFPAHLSSTPITSSGAVKVTQTKIFTDISVRAKLQQTPFKKVPGKLCELVQRKLADANLHPLALLPDTDEAISSTSDNNDIVLLENEDDFSASNAGACRDIAREPSSQYENTFSSILSREPDTRVSVSSMTESSLWTSMTRIVKSVLGFTNMNDDSSNISLNSSSSKRQLSDSDTGDFIEAPRRKRFKFTDIKCRRTIRDLPAIELPRSLPLPAPPLASSIEIVKSVSTLYGRQTMIIQCDKATQTDHYLMHGWYPHV